MWELVQYGTYQLEKDKTGTGGAKTHPVPVELLVDLLQTCAVHLYFKKATATCVPYAWELSMFTKLTKNKKSKKQQQWWFLQLASHIPSLPSSLQGKIKEMRKSS